MCNLIKRKKPKQEEKNQLTTTSCKRLFYFGKEKFK